MRVWTLSASASSRRQSRPGWKRCWPSTDGGGRCSLNAAVERDTPVYELIVEGHRALRPPSLGGTESQVSTSTTYPVAKATSSRSFFIPIWWAAPQASSSRRPARSLSPKDPRARRARARSYRDPAGHPAARMRSCTLRAPPGGLRLHRLGRESMPAIRSSDEPNRNRHGRRQSRTRRDDEHSPDGGTAGPPHWRHQGTQPPPPAFRGPEGL